MNTSVLREIVNFADIVVMIFGIVGSVGGFVFWWDSRTIREEVNKKLESITEYLDREVKNSAIVLSCRVQRTQDSNTIKIATIEEEIEQLKTIFRCTATGSMGKCIKSVPAPNLNKISKSIPDNTDFT